MSLWIPLLLVKLIMAALAQEDYCRQGTYGNNCELKCPDQCRPFQTFPCDKITGQCSEGCNSGYFGDQCDKQCSCASGICYQRTGECFGIVPATATATLNMTDRVSRTFPSYLFPGTTASLVHTKDIEGVAAGWRTTAIILIVVIIFLVFAGVTMFLYVRFKKMKTLTDAKSVEGEALLQKDLEAAGDELQPLGDQTEAKNKENQRLLDAIPREGEAISHKKQRATVTESLDEIPREGEAISQKQQPAGGQGETESLGDQAEKKPQELKESTGVEDLRQKNQRLKDENKENQNVLGAIPREGEAISHKKQPAGVMESQGDKAEKKPQLLKGSTEVEDLRQETPRLKDECKEKQKLLDEIPGEGEAISQKQQPAGGQCEVTESRGDQAEKKPQLLKGFTEVEDLRQENQRLKDEKDRAEAKCEEMKKHIKSLEFQDKENQRLLGLPINSKNHLMNNDQWLQCPNLKFDKEMVNVKVAQIDGNSVLFNNPDTGSRGSNMKRFQNFRGTTCTEPLVKSGFYQYFEAVFDIDIKQPIEEGEVVMQLGFCKENDRDKTPFLEIKKKSFVMEVVNCKIHNKICLVSINNGKNENIQEVMDNVEGARQRVIIGIRLDIDMKKIKVYDGLKLNLLQETEITIGDKIWPMFGVCDDRSASVSVQLKVGGNIPMEKEKKETLKLEHI